MSHHLDWTTEQRCDDCDDEHQQALLDDAKGGSAAAHEELLMIQARWMLPWLERELPRRLRSKLDADDLLQDAHLHAWRGFAQLKGGSIAEYRAWLREICRNCLLSSVERFLTALCRDAAREVRLNEYAILNGRQRPLHRRWSAAGTGQAALEAVEEIEQLLAGLPRRTRQVVIFHVIDDREFDDIAHELDCSVRTVCRGWQHARDELRRRRAHPTPAP